MSGIFGYYDPDGHLPPDAAPRMAGALAVGPNCRVTFHQAGSACIGVVDNGISPGASQVLHNDGETRYAVFQGEISGVSGTDDGLDSITRAQRLFCSPIDERRLAAAIGPFAAAIYDQEANAILVVGDRYGLYLTFYAQVGTAVLFAGQGKALLATGIISAALDDDALALMLTIGEVVGELTLIQAIRVLPSACIARLDATGVAIRKYWRYTYRSDPDVSFGQAAERAGVLLRGAVSRPFGSHQTIGVPLSGGLDSRVILSATPEPSRVPTYTWGVDACRDHRYARRVTAVLGSPHHEFVYDPVYVEKLGERGVWLTEGLCGVTDMHVLPYVASVRASSPVILDGYAGDAVLGGNFIRRDWWDRRSPEAAAAALWRWRARMLTHETGERLLGVGPYRDVLERARKRFCDCFASYEADTEMDRAMAFLLDNHVRRCTSGGVQLFRSRLELHFPFFDNDFFDYITRLPHVWRHRHRIYIEMIRRCFRAVGQIPWQRTGLSARARWPVRFFSVVAHRANEWAARRTRWPDVLCGRHVSRFDEWLRGPLRAFSERILLSERTANRGIFQREGLRTIMHQHQMAADHSKVIGTLIAIELFHRLFSDDFSAAWETYSVGTKLQGACVTHGASPDSAK